MSLFGAIGRTIYWTNWTDRPFVTRKVAEQQQAKIEAPKLGEIREGIALSIDERRELVRAVWYISRRETLRECANLGRAPRIEEFFELEGL